MSEAVLSCWLNAQLSLAAVPEATETELFNLAGWWATLLNEYQLAVQD